jgi:5-methyltetrahydrofolate--homocysteine methyltransferase
LDDIAADRRKHLRNTYVEDWQRIKDRFEQWWNREPWDKPADKPLMRIIAAGKPGRTAAVEKPREPRDQYLDVSAIIAGFRNYCETHYFLQDAFPAADIDLGPGSMALYLGGEPDFAWDTVWYKETCESPREFAALRYDEHNRWWTLHQKMAEEAAALAAGDFYVTIPDIIENLDILSALRGPQNLCYDMLDEPEAVHRGVDIVDSVYFRYYDRLYDILKDDDGSSSYTAFRILGKGRAAKIQCDYSALISPDMFREYVQPSLRKQCRNLDHSIYHLDGPDAIKHVPALMEIEELDALQWTCGAGKPDGSCEQWYPIYDQVRAAGKSLWIQLYDGDASCWAESAKRLVKRYGKTGMYFLFPEFTSLGEAQKMANLFG